MSKGVIISLFDYTGNWSKPWAENGYDVVLVDIKHGKNIYEFDDVLEVLKNFGIYGVLAAPPCTDFSVSGSQHWDKKDKDGRTSDSIALVEKTLKIIEASKPKFWCIENPVGRLGR